MKRALPNLQVSVFQLLAGRDFAESHALAGQMANYVYVLVPQSDPSAAVLVDPCYNVAEVAACAAAGGAVAIATALFTHRHPDHVGGSFGGVVLEGLREVLELVGGPTCGVGALDLPATAKQCHVDPARLTALHDGDTVTVGPHAAITVIHTPGHTDGSLCFQLQQLPCSDQEASFPAQPTAVFTGDTLFIGSCGKWQDSQSLRYLVMSLDRLAELPDDTIVFPGHNYAHPTSSTIGREKGGNDLMMQALEAAPKLRDLAATQPGILAPVGFENGVAVLGRRKASFTPADTRHLPTYIACARQELTAEALAKCTVVCTECTSTAAEPASALCHL